MYGYNGQRVGASAVALGIAQGAHDLAIDYMKKRQAFGRPISEFQGLQWMMADAEMELNAARLLIYRAACNASELPNNVRLPYMDEASMAKAYTGHAALHVVSESLQMFGAAGYSSPAPGADVPGRAHVPDRRRYHPGPEEHDRPVDFQQEVQPAQVGRPVGADNGPPAAGSMRAPYRFTIRFDRIGKNGQQTAA
jgi:hypothetical protein